MAILHCRAVMGVSVYVFLATLVSCGGQIQEDNLSFYLDSRVNCKGQMYDLSKRRAYIYGTGGRESSAPMTACYLSLKSEIDVIAAKTVLQIEVTKLKIYDCDVSLTIYDGGREQLIIDSYDCNTGKNRVTLLTTGNRVTFVLKRRDVQTSETQYDMELIVTPLFTGRDPDPGAPGSGGSDEYIRFEKRIPTEAIIGIVGGLLVITVIIIVIVTVKCYRKHHGDDKPWVEHNKLAYINMGVAEEPKSANHSSTRLWASQNSRRAVSNEDYLRRPPSYEDSVFEDETLPRKRPVYDDHDRRSGYDHRSDHPAARDRQYRPRDDSFVQADDDHPQDSYQEKVICPRVKTAPRRWVVENHDDDEDDDDDEPPQRRNHWAEAGSADEEEEEEAAAQKDESEEEEEEAETEESEAESEEEDEEPQTGNQQAAPRTSVPGPPAQNAQLTGQPQMFLPQGRLPPVQMPPNMMMRAPAPQYVIYPVPVGPNQFQPVNPGAPVQREQRKPPSPKMTSRDPPTYSHLVRRGYDPQGGRNSPAGRSTPGTHGSDPRLHRSGESELSEPSLTSGVELMRR
ncbi:uncharacterized protein LOC121366381 isoform X2 [Gigantopelta aegis]|uniref:uncharacterized protein LOC121366381 isoform X2 n=1 Tax=Gigantopelta aegis TaxID=1735272 RepID=UPI001B88B1AA|nr:uncharacterized protein LOC121366381 isoform X2 [Gigantopelta aegis]